MTRGTLSEKFPMNYHTYATLNIPRYLVIAPSKSGQKGWTDEEITDALKTALKDTGGKYLSSNKYSAWYAEQPAGSRISLPGLGIARGSWIEACRRSGVPHGETSLTYTKGWDIEEILAVVGEYVERCYERKERPVYSGYDEEQKKHKDWPSGSTARNISGMGWTELVQRSG